MPFKLNYSLANLLIKHQIRPAIRNFRYPQQNRIKSTNPLRTMCSSAATNSSSQLYPNKMFGLQIHAYGGIDEIQYSDNIKIPIIKNANDVLVKIIATSINPLDIAMMSKYS